MRTMALLLLLSLSGACAASQPKKRLAEAVHTMNDAARWGRIGSAVAMVEPAYQARFLKAHSGWGEDVQLADSEVVQVDMSTEEAAVAIIAYRWYSLRTMTLHSTMVQQNWVRLEDKFQLVSETVLKGDDQLFSDDQEPEG